MLIIEGADHLGKTTAAKQIVKQAGIDGKYPIRYSHMSRPNETFDFLHDYQDMSSKFAVQDRFHLGGLVWHRGKITSAALRIIEGRLQVLGSVCIVVYTSDVAWYRQALQEKGKDEMFSPEVIMAANRRFMELAESTVWCDYMYDVKDGRFPDAGTCRTWLNHWYESLACLERPRNESQTLHT